MDKLHTYLLSAKRLLAQTFSKKKRKENMDNNLIPPINAGFQALDYICSLIDAGLLDVNISDGVTLISIKLHMLLVSEDLSDKKYFFKKPTEEHYARFFSAVRAYLNIQRGLKQGDLIRKVDEGIFDTLTERTREQQKESIEKTWDEFLPERTIPFMVFDDLKTMNKLYYTGIQNVNTFDYSAVDPKRMDMD